MPIDISFNTDDKLNKYATKTYSDQSYINVEGDLMQGNLNMNDHKIVGLAEPTDSKDCVTKSYVDRRLTENLRGCLQGTLITVKFNLIYLPAVAQQVLGTPYSDEPFIVGLRFKRGDGFWVDGKQSEVEVAIKQNALYIRRKALFPIRELTGEGEVLLLKGGTTIRLVNERGVVSGSNIGVATASR